MRSQSGIGRRRVPVGAACLAGMFLWPWTLSASTSPAIFLTRLESPDPGERRVTARINPQLCVSFALPEGWRQRDGVPGEVLLSNQAGSGVLALTGRAVDDLSGPLHENATLRDAALLQREQEALFGRPAQASATTPIVGGTRWTATWSDPHLPSPTQSLTVETYIVSASPEWLVEISPSAIADRQTHDEVIGRFVSRLRADRCRAG